MMKHLRRFLGNIWQPLVILENLWASSEIFGNDRKCLYELPKVFREFSKVFRYLQNMLGNLGEIAKISCFTICIMIPSCPDDNDDDI